jgi:cell division protein ZapA
MGQVTVTLNRRTYRLACGDGDEARLQDLSAYVKAKVETLAARFGQVGDDRLLLMAALLITDELFDARSPTETADNADDPAERAAGATAANEAATVQAKAPSPAA